MAIAHDATTRFPATENTADGTTGDRTFTHTPVGTPKGVVIVLCNSGTTSAVVTGVLYGGVAMVESRFATDSTELGRVSIYTLTAGIPTGAQTVTLQGCAVNTKFCTCNTLTAAGDTRVLTSNSVEATAADPTISLTTSATTMSYCGLHTGAAAPAVAANAGTTLQNNRDYGTLAAQTARRTNPDAAGTVTFTFTLASDDYAIAAVAMAEEVQARPPSQRYPRTAVAPPASNAVYL